MDTLEFQHPTLPVIVRVSDQGYFAHPTSTPGNKKFWFVVLLNARAGWDWLRHTEPDGTQWIGVNKDRGVHHHTADSRVAQALRLTLAQYRELLEYCKAHRNLNS